MRFSKYTALIVSYSLLVTPFNTFANFLVNIKNRDNSVSGERVEEKSIPYNKIIVPDQEEGDVLFFDALADKGAGAWRAYPISGLNFVGGWNVKENIPKIFGGGYYEDQNGNKTAAVSGDYFIVEKEGQTIFDGNSFVSWAPGDWLIFNGEFWDKISNNGTVARVFGRKGHILAGDDAGNPVFDYNWNQVVNEPYRMKPYIDANKSSIFDIEDIEKPASINSIASGSVLKWDEASKKWKLAKDEVGITGLIQSSNIVDGEILDEDISPSAGIKINKIDGLEVKLNEKLDSVNGTLIGDLDTSNALLFNRDSLGKSAKINGVSLEELHQKVLSLEITLASKQDKLSQATDKHYLDEQMVFSTLNTDDVEEISGFGEFLNDDRVVNTILSDFENTVSAASTGGALATESLIEVLKRFQDQINNSTVGKTFGENDIPNESIELSHLANDVDGSMFSNAGAGSYGEGFLVYQDPNWSTEQVSGGLVFKSTWDASTGVYPADPSIGDFFVVSADGAVGSDSYVKGDWLVCVYPPSSDPQDPPERWLRINNAGQVYGFKGAKDSDPRVGSLVPEVGDYTWAMIDKTNAKLSDFSDVDLSKAPGDVLKYRTLDTDGDGSIDWSGWTLGSDETGAGAGQISGTSILPGSITSSSIIANANIQQSKFLGLTNSLNGMLHKSGGSVGANFDINYQNLTNLTQINGKNLQPFFNDLATIDSTLLLKEDKLADNLTADEMFYNESKSLIIFNTDSFPEGSSNLYFNDARVFDTLLNIADPTSPPDVSEVVAGNTLGKAIQKMESQIKTGTVPSGSLDGANIDDDAITLDKLAKSTTFIMDTQTSSPGEGDTYKVLEKQTGTDSSGDPILTKYWGWSSITGINYVGNWDVASFPDIPVNPSNGDYYILTSTGNDADLNSWTTGDWAIYDEATASFNKIPSPGNFQKFNGRDKAVVPMVGDYTFDMLDFTGSSIGDIEDVDVTTNPPTSGQVLKYQEINGVKKWAPGTDDGGLNGKITTAEVVDNTVKSDAFEANTFKKAHFQQELQTKIDEHYGPGDNLASNLNFGGKNLINCTMINGVNVIDLYNNCVSEDPNLYLPLLPAVTYLPYNTSIVDHPNSKNENYFLNEKGVFSRIDINDLGSGTKNFTYDEDAIRALPLISSYHTNLDSAESKEIESDDTLWEAIAKIWRKASQVLTLTPGGIHFKNSYTVVSGTDDQKTFIVTGGDISLPASPKNGFTVTIKRKSPADVKVVAGTGVFIDSFEEKLILKENYASVRLIYANTETSKSSKRWHLIHQKGLIE